MRTLFENWDERNKFLAKRFFIRKWYMQVKKLKQRDNYFNISMNIFDKKSLIDNVKTLSDVSQIYQIYKAVTVARVKDFFNQLRIVWGDWVKIRTRILYILGKHIEIEEEKRINYLKIKLYQWRDKAKYITKKISMIRITKWTEDKYRISKARHNWKTLSGKYSIFINKSYLFHIKTKLRKLLKLISLVEKLRNKLKFTEFEQYKESNKIKNILNVHQNKTINNL